MNEKALHTLEFDKIIRELAQYASSRPGRERCLGLVPSPSLSEINRMQDETSAAVARILRKGSISFGSTSDIRPSLMRLEIGSALGIHELLEITKLLENAGLVRAWAARERENEEPDILTPMFSGLDALPSVTAEIRRCILSEDEIADGASARLRDIRRNIRAANDRVHSELTRIVSGPARNYLQDSIITTRDGRYCIPVKNEYRAQVPGIIHDQSKAGSTLFIEPASVVRLNNEIRELLISEEKEIEVILARLSSLFAEDTGIIRADYDAMTELDFIFARARLALEENAVRPDVGTDGVISLRQARHPLISKNTVVPIDVRLGEDFDLLVVTGPNTGGKTVSLKTTGLLTMMGLAGLHIPAGSRSRISVFQEIYADIGDEQSIEQSLSTFSSHMKNVVEFLDKADRDSLVLFDELGAGTDPTEGAALAISILDRLHAEGIRTMATTHYSEIKIYALRTPGVENASCEFNVETLSPTYRLLIGVPGKSNAFAISKRLGLPDDVIEHARALLSNEDVAFEDVISGLEKQRSELEKEKIEIGKTQADLAKRSRELKSREDRLTSKKRDLLSESSEEARRILEEAKDYADKTITWYAKHGGNTREMEQRRTDLRERMNRLDKNVRTVRGDAAPEKGHLTAKDLKIGDSVKVLSLGLKGTVSTLPDKDGNLFVTLGIMRMKVKLNDLELVPEEDITGPGLRKTGSGRIGMAKSLAVSPEINLLGKTVDEACAELDKYLDDAALAHLETVRIVHGKGTGALRRGVQQYLKRNKHVKSFRLGEFGEGDAGVTIATLK